jgi:two-component system, cell cycle response regulator
MVKDPSLILLVDNDPEFTYLIERYSRMIDWKVIQADGAEAALAQICKVKPAMIMLNLMIPPTGGWEVLRVLKMNALTQGIPITVYSSIPDEERAWGEGADFCLWKPIMLEEFVASLEAANLFVPRQSPGGEQSRPTTLLP